MQAWYSRRGQFQGIEDNGNHYPVGSLMFNKLLRAEGVTLQEFEDDNPYIAPAKSQTQIDREGLISDLESGTARFDVEFQRKLAKLL